MKRKFFCLFVIVILILSLGNTYFTYAEESGSEESPIAPNLIIGRNYKMPVFKAGTEARLAIPIENTTSGEAQNIFATPVIEGEKDFPFQIDSMVTRKKISSITGRNTENAVFYLNVRKNAEAKMYPIKLNIEYTSSNGGSFGFSETIYIKVENEYETPSIKLMDVKIDGGKLISGTTKSVGLTLRNEGDMEAKDVKAKLSGFSNNELLLDSTLDTIDVRTLAAKEVRTIYFNISADSDLDGGTYSLDLILNYKDEYDLQYETKAKVYLPLEDRASAQTDFTFENLAYPKEAVKPYTDFNVSFNLKNSGNEDAKNVKVTIDAGDEILPKSLAIKNINNLGAGQSAPVEFTLFAKEKIESKNYPIRIIVEYSVGTGSKKDVQSFNQYIGVFVDSDDRDMGTPKVMVDWYDYAAEYIKAGETFPLTISFYNTNKSKDVRNIRVSISSDGDVFSPVGSSNSIFIEKIPANNRVERLLTLKPKIDAAYKTHNIFADIEYEDNRGEIYNTKELIGIPVIQEANLIMGDLVLSDENFVGMPIALSLEFYNGGRGLMRNMVISIDGNFDTHEGSLYIGNLDAGNSNYYDATIIPINPGALNGKIIFEYDDEIDEHHIIEKEFSLEIMEQMQPEMPEDFMQYEENSSSIGKGKIGLGVGIIILAGFGGFVFYRRRKKKLEEVDAYE